MSRNVLSLLSVTSVRSMALTGVLGLAALGLGADPGFAQNTGCILAAGCQAQQQQQQQQTTATSTSQSGAQSGSASIAGSASNNAGNQQNINFNSPGNQTIKNTPNVYSPGLAAAGSEVCLGSVSAGGVGAGFGLTLGGTIVDRECQLRLNARTLATLGYAAAARETMCLDDDVRRAMYMAGTPCAADRAGPGWAGAAVYSDNGHAAYASAAPTAPRAKTQMLMPGSSSPTATRTAANPPGMECHTEFDLFRGMVEVCN